MIMNALPTPGMALIRATMILLSDLMRLKRRKTRKARSILSIEKGPRGTRTRVRTPTKTTIKSKMFQPLVQNFLCPAP